MITNLENPPLIEHISTGIKWMYADGDLICKAVKLHIEREQKNPIFRFC